MFLPPRPSSALPLGKKISAPQRKEHRLSGPHFRVRGISLIRAPQAVRAIRLFWTAMSSDTTGEDLSNQILADIYLTRPTAWSIWQPDYPALMNIDYTNQAYTLNEAYYVFEQYTKFIRPGFQFIAIADPQSLAAFNQRNQTLVIVTQNWNKAARSVTYQLSSFTSLGTSRSEERR